jgi:hypothetical protein
MTYPDVSGKWKLTATNLSNAVEGTKPSFSNIRTVSLEITVEQRKQFLIVTMPPHPTRVTRGYRTGVITKVYYNPKKYYWKISMVDDDDNGKSELTIANMKNGKPCKLTGCYVESGYSASDSDQKQTVDSQVWTKIL